MKKIDAIWIFFVFQLVLVESHVRTRSFESEKIPLKNGSSPRKLTRKPEFKFPWNDPQVQVEHAYAAMTAKLNCSVKGRPRPKMTWFRNGVEITSENDRPGASKFYAMDKKRQILKMEESTPSDSGNFSCIAENTVGKIERFFKVEIEPRIVAQRPVIDENSPGNHTVLVNTDLILECPIINVDSFDPPEMFWIRLHPGTFDDKEWEYPNKTPKFDVLQKCSARGNCYNSTSDMWDIPMVAREYHLYNLTESDSTGFCCVAKNSYGNDSKCGYIKVLTHLPDPQADTRKIILMATVIPSLVLISLLAFTLFYAWEQKAKREKTDKYARSVVVWTKRVMIHMENNNNDSNGSEILEPRVDIQKTRVNPSLFSSSANFSEYEYPCDPEWEFDRGKLNFLEPLGEGAFGLVTKAEAKFPDGRISTVAVKTLKEGHTDHDVIDLCKEMTIMKKIPHHDNIINLIGVCTQPLGCPIYVVVEYAKHGNLRDYLINRRSGLPCENCSHEYLEPESAAIYPKKCHCILSLEDLLSIGWQVAKGMDFLCLSKCVHRDLAARNILVCDGNLVKIADFGLARSIENSEYYRKTTEGKIPIKWMAPEAVHHRIYTSQSDVWSFGILLWEIMTMGESPFKDVQIDVFMEKLRNGVTYLAQPKFCPSSVYAVMQDCWRFLPQDRPSWPSLVNRMHILCASAEPQKYTIL